MRTKLGIRVGQIIGPLTILNRIPDGHKIYWNCQCFCGKTAELTSQQIMARIARPTSPRLTCFCKGPRFYSKPEIAEIRRLAAEGLSASRIGCWIGRSRNSVMNICYRQKILLKGEKGAPYGNKNGSKTGSSSRPDLK